MVSKEIDEMLDIILLQNKKIEELEVRLANLREANKIQNEIIDHLQELHIEFLEKEINRILTNKSKKHG